MTKYPLSSNTWNNKEITSIIKILRTGMLTMGEKVYQFEKIFSQYVNKKYTVMVNSGSSANLLMFSSILYKKNLKNFFKQKNEVIVPAVSWSTSYYPIQQCGFKMNFIDVDIKTLNYDLKMLEKAINKNTKIILLVSVLGNPNNIKEIKKIIKKSKKKILLLSDNCESLGAFYENSHIGKESLISTFSSYFSHHISTIEGGMISTDDKEIYQILLSLRSHGWTRNLPNRNLVTGKKNLDSFKEHFNFILPGYNLRPTEINAVAGIEQMKKIKKFINFRRKNAQYFISLFKNKNNFYIQKEIGKSSWFGFSLILKEKSKIKFERLKKIFKKLGVEIRPIISGNFFRQPVTKKFLDFKKTGNLKNADHLTNYGLMFGNQPKNLKKIIKKISEIKI